MNPENLLSQLRDAHAPEPIGLWPFAPGWWILIIGGLLLITTLIYLCIRYWRDTSWKRQALTEFKVMRNRYLKQPSVDVLFDVNQLMKRILCTVRGTRKYMHYAEQDWAIELNSVKTKNAPVLHEEEIRFLSHDIYRPTENLLDKTAFMRIEQWIKKVS